LESVRKEFFQSVTPVEERPGKPKVTIVGVGQVGMACAISILQKGNVREIALVDVLEDKLKGEKMDLEQSASLFHPVTIKASSDYSVTADSDICVVTAGARQREGETRIALVERNVAIFKSIIPLLTKFSPNAILLVVSNPCDILTWVVWKLSGFPPHRVIGSGTTLDSSRFRFMLAEQLTISPRNVHGYIIGEHGDSSVPVWSGVSVGGVRLQSVIPNAGKGGDNDEIGKIAQKVKDSAYEVIKLKGYTSWAIGMCVATLVYALLNDSEEIFPVSTSIKGLYGVKEEVFVSLPAVLTRNGIREVVKINLDQDEQANLLKSVQSLGEVQSKIQL